ncbi:hypothetical protein [Chondromyces crocatus]|uniref:Uncharacterized protein n=1 Tax=Chondromyces crocatus TaxID=52 RepID=A0A0K1EGS7_CHOCO|nr:hypothetical protein [Chondromyces crocatus]AKT40055.1 uncharacterized protein CMC5_042080 [Chondromyces crocatus]
MDNPLATQLHELLEAGGGEPMTGGRYLPLVTLDSGARVGLDAAASWILVPDEGSAPRPYTLEQAHSFYEVLETKRQDFDDTLEEAARAAGLPAEEILFSFPAISIVRSVLDKGLPYMTRLALLWVRNTELRELRDAILTVSRSQEMPIAVRELATHLVVPA